MLTGKPKEEHICPVCGSSKIRPFMDSLDVPVYCNQLCLTREQATKANRSDILLTFCKKCGHVFNRAFSPELMDYDQDYDNSLHFSPLFQEYAESLAEELVEKYDVKNKDVIEIGCGKGDFLKLLCELGENRGVGFDPSYEEKRWGQNSSFRVIQDLYSEKYQNYKADMVCCRHVLEHIQKPAAFLQSIKDTLREQKDPILFFEVPNIMFTLKDLGVWDLIYEHCGYFSKSSLAYLFESCGFRVLEIRESFGGQFLCIEAIPDYHESQAPIVANKDYLGDMERYILEFADTYAGQVKKWCSTLREMKGKKQKIVIWGAGSKGVTFLNNIQDKDQIKYIVDINPQKQGKYVPGTGQKIVPSEYLKEYRSHVVIVMNPMYLEEITDIITQLGLSSSVITV